VVKQNRPMEIYALGMELNVKPIKTGPRVHFPVKRLKMTACKEKKNENFFPLCPQSFFLYHW
jgi:hypothetical protein